MEITISNSTIANVEEYLRPYMTNTKVRIFSIGGKIYKGKVNQDNTLFTFDAEYPELEKEYLAGILVLLDIKEYQMTSQGKIIKTNIEVKA